jgi:hypothetical protein
MQLMWGDPRDLASREGRSQLIELEAREFDQTMHQAFVIEAMNRAPAQPRPPICNWNMSKRLPFERLDFPVYLRGIFDLATVLVRE